MSGREKLLTYHVRPMLPPTVAHLAVVTILVTVVCLRVRTGMPGE